MPMPPKNDKIYPGQRVRVRAKTVDPETRDPIDVGELQVIFKRPNDIETMVTMTSAEDGQYAGSIVVDDDGQWYWRIEGDTSNVEVALEGEFKVEPSSFS